ncbi:hypothetical protein D3C87_1623930 [compost metagenome]
MTHKFMQKMNRIRSNLHVQRLRDIIDPRRNLIFVRFFKLHAIGFIKQSANRFFALIYTRSHDHENSAIHSVVDQRLKLSPLAVC